MFKQIPLFGLTKTRLPKTKTVKRSDTHLANVRVDYFAKQWFVFVAPVNDKLDSALFT